MCSVMDGVVIDALGVALGRSIERVRRSCVYTVCVVEVVLAGVYAVRLVAKGARVLVWCACVVVPRRSWWLKRVPRGHRARAARLARGSARVARAARTRVQQLDPRPRGGWKRRVAHAVKPLELEPPPSLHIKGSLHIGRAPNVCHVADPQANP